MRAEVIRLQESYTPNKSMLSILQEIKTLMITCARSGGNGVRFTKPGDITHNDVKYISDVFEEAGYEVTTLDDIINISWE